MLPQAGRRHPSGAGRGMADSSIEGHDSRKTCCVASTDRKSPTPTRPGWGRSNGARASSRTVRSKPSTGIPRAHRPPPVPTSRNLDGDRILALDTWRDHERRGERHDSPGRRPSNRGDSGAPDAGTPARPARRRRAGSTRRAPGRKLVAPTFQEPRDEGTANARPVSARRRRPLEGHAHRDRPPPRRQPLPRPTRGDPRVRLRLRRHIGRDRQGRHRLGRGASRTGRGRGRRCPYRDVDRGRSRDSRRDDDRQDVAAGMTFCRTPPEEFFAPDLLATRHEAASASKHWIRESANPTRVSRDRRTAQRTGSAMRRRWSGPNRSSRRAQRVRPHPGRGS